MEYKEVGNLYPLLPPSAPPTNNQASMYRLQKISEIQQALQTERDKRGDLSKKYHRSIKIIRGLDDTLVVTSIGLGLSGVALMTGIITTPVAIATEIVALGTGMISLIGNVVNRKLQPKAEKHEKIKVLAEAKLNTISDHISKALKDDVISDDEYSLILSELDKFNQMKGDIRTKTRITLDDEAKNSLINEGREQAMNKVKKLLEK